MLTAVKYYNLTAVMDESCVLSCCVMQDDSRSNILWHKKKFMHGCYHVFFRCINTYPQNRHQSIGEEKRNRVEVVWCLEGEKMAGIVVVFDFDKTIIEVDSDNWVVDELGATDLFNQLLPTMPWNSLMVS